MSNISLLHINCVIPNGGDGYVPSQQSLIVSSGDNYIIGFNAVDSYGSEYVPQVGDAVFLTISPANTYNNTSGSIKLEALLFAYPETTWDGYWIVDSGTSASLSFMQSYDFGVTLQDGYGNISQICLVSPLPVLKSVFSPSEAVIVPAGQTPLGLGPKGDTGATGPQGPPGPSSADGYLVATSPILVNGVAGPLPIDQTNTISMAASGVTAGSYTSTNITVDAYGRVTAASDGSGGVTSVSNSDGTLTVSPTTGDVVASLNLGNANTWTADQTFNSIFINVLDVTANGTIQSTAQAATNTTALTIKPNIASGASSVTLAIDTATGFSTGQGKLISFRNGGTEFGYLTEQGTLNMLWFQSRSLYGIALQAATNNLLISSAADGSSAVSCIIDTNNAWSNASAKLASFRTNGTEKVYIGADGGLSLNGDSLASLGQPTKRWANVYAYGISDGVNASLTVNESSGTTLTYATNAIGIDATDITVSLGGGGALKTTGFVSYIGTSTAVPTITWTQPTLINSWANYGAPGALVQYTKSATGQVTLLGWLKSGTSGTVAFVLPAGYRPSTTLQFPTTADSSHLGIIQIDPSGNVSVYDVSGGSSVSTLATLDSIHFFALL